MLCMLLYSLTHSWGYTFLFVVVIIVVHIVEYNNLHIEENHQVLICSATSWVIYHNLHIEMISFLLSDIKYRSIFRWGLLVCKQILFPCLDTNDFVNRWLCGSSFAFHVNFCRCLRFSLFLFWLLVLLLVHVKIYLALLGRSFNMSIKKYCVRIYSSSRVHTFKEILYFNPLQFFQWAFDFFFLTFFWISIYFVISTNDIIFFSINSWFEA